MDAVPAFEAIVGAAHVQPGAGADLDGAAVDAVVQPGDPDEVAACLERAYVNGVALVVRGGGTKLGQGHPPRSERVCVLDTTRLASPLDLDADEGIVTVGAGVRVAVLEDAARAAGRRTRAPAGGSGATLGGTIASDPLGSEQTPDRGLRNDLLGIEVALANGKRTRAGGRVVKNVTGFDLVRLYCGSFGTLGVVTSATLRLRPLPDVRRILVRELASVEAALEARVALDAASVDAAAVAVLPEAGRTRLLWQVEGGAADVAARAGRFEGTTADEAAWAEVSTRLNERPSGAAVLRVAGRPSDLPAILRQVQRVAGRVGVRAVLPALGAVLAHVDEAAVSGLLDSSADSGWATRVEHGSAALRERVDVFGRPGPDLVLMRALKQRFDPGGVLAPGRFMGRI